MSIDTGCKERDRKPRIVIAFDSVAEFRALANDSGIDWAANALGRAIKAAAKMQDIAPPPPAAPKPDDTP